MNDVMAGSWKQLHGQMKETWGKLTDDDFAAIDGKRENLVGVLQTRYGYAKSKAETEVNERLAEWQKSSIKNRNGEQIEPQAVSLPVHIRRLSETFSV